MTDPPTILIVGTFVILAAAVTQGLTGFGFNLVAVPLLLIVLPPATVVPLVMIQAGLVTLAIAVEARRWVNVKGMWPLMIAGVVGTPFGVHLLKALDANVLKVLIGAAIAAFGIAFLRGFAVQVRSEKLAMAPVGFVSGLLGGSTGMSGPPVILFLTNQGVGKQAFRANLAVYFTCLSIVSVIAFLRVGLMTETVMRYTLLLLPALVVGGIAGIKLAGSVDEGAFRKVALIVVTIAGLVATASGLKLF